MEKSAGFGIIAQSEIKGIPNDQTTNCCLPGEGSGVMILLINACSGGNNRRLTAILHLFILKMSGTGRPNVNMQVFALKSG
jgi:hypothetical protein